MQEKLGNKVNMNDTKIVKAEFVSLIKLWKDLKPVILSDVLSDMFLNYAKKLCQPMQKQVTMKETLNSTLGNSLGKS